MSAALIGIAAEIGAPLVRDILARKIGGKNAELAETVVTAIASRAGVPAEQLGEAARADDGRAGQVRDAIRAVNAELAPHLVALHEAELETKLKIFEAEQEEPALARLWRPMGMYFTFLLWAWNVMILHVANAWWRIALPPTPWDVLLAWTGLYLSLYMGGHTVKAVAESWGRK